MIRYLLMTFLPLMGLVSVTYGVQSLRLTEDATIYSNSDGSKEKGEVKENSVVYLMKKDKDRTMVKTSTGLKGWVKNSSMEFYKQSNKGDKYNLDNQDITGWLDNPSAIYILDNSGLNTDAMPLTRSFQEEIFEKKDREEIERSNDEN